MALAMAAAIGSRTIALWLIGKQTMAWRPMVDSRWSKVYIDINSIMHQSYFIRGNLKIHNQMLPDRPPEMAITRLPQQGKSSSPSSP